MRKELKITLIVLVILAVILFPLIGIYNNIVNLDQNVNAKSSNIDTNLQRRSDLIPNLVQTVKGYAVQEKTIFTDIAAQRAKLAGAQTIGDKANADSALSGSLNKLLAIVENYPQLKSDQNFRDLSVALEGTENRIAIARQDYNSSVTIYNSAIKRFPNSIISGAFGFNAKPFYKAAEGSQIVPKVSF